MCYSEQMRSLRLSSKPQNKPAIDLFADKSALVLHWLLTYGHESELSVREVSRKVEVSLGLVQRVFEALVRTGILSVSGQNTAKVYKLKKPKRLFEQWSSHYDILKKCKVWAYDSGYATREELLSAIRITKYNDVLTPALHTAAAVQGLSNTNLDSVEIYLKDPKVRSQIEKKFHLIPKERGYQVLLIYPYYKAILEFEKRCPELLMVLDLMHFPLRGQEQAEHIIRKTAFMRKFYGK